MGNNIRGDQPPESPCPLTIPCRLADAMLQSISAWIGFVFGRRGLGRDDGTPRPCAGPEAERAFRRP